MPLPSPWASSFASFGTIDLYPCAFVLPDGKLLVHSRNTTRIYDPVTNFWGAEMVTQYPFSRTYPGEGSAVLLPLSPATGYRPRVLLLGGGGADPAQLTPDTPATNTAEILDLGAAHPAWRYTQPMQYGRLMVDAVLLPDGTVLAVGGSSTGRNDNTPRPTLTRNCSTHSPRPGGRCVRTGFPPAITAQRSCFPTAAWPSPVKTAYSNPTSSNTPTIEWNCSARPTSSAGHAPQ
jgi:hypothetical protein